MGKQVKLLALAKLRQATRWPGYNCIGDYHRGAYECDFVSPYTKTAGNVNAEIMVMLQDWASDDVLRGPFHEHSATLGHDPSRPTNKNLIKLLNMTFDVALRDTYGTNLFPFIKHGHMSTKIPPRDMLAAAQTFALPQIHVLHPKLVICLGLDTFDALRQASDLSRTRYLDSAIESPFNIGTTRVWCQAHTGRLSNRGTFERVLADWRKMKEDIKVPPDTSSQRGDTQPAVFQTAQSATGKKILGLRSRRRHQTQERDKVNTFILNNKSERDHRRIYPLDKKLKGCAIYDYDETQGRHAFNSDFRAMKPGDRALVFGRNLKVKSIFRITGIKRDYAPDVSKDVSVIYGEYFDTLVDPVRYRDFITTSKLSNPHLDPHNNFRRGMLVAHVY